MRVHTIWFHTVHWDKKLCEEQAKFSKFHQDDFQGLLLLFHRGKI